MRRFMVALMGGMTCVVLGGCGQGSNSEATRAPSASPPVASSPAMYGEEAGAPAVAFKRAPSAEAASAEYVPAEYSAAEGVADAAAPARAMPLPAGTSAKPASGPAAAREPADEAPAASPVTAPSSVPAERLDRKIARRDPGPDPLSVRQSRVQSGTLTAGSFDDNERFDDYRQFLSEAMQQDAGETLPRVAVGERVLIHVLDPQGEPVGDARVVVRERNAGQRVSREGEAAPVLVDLTTASDGRVMFLTGRDGAAPDGEFLVTVHPPGEGEPVEQVMHLDQRPWRITLPGARSKLPRKLDLALVIDTTGSMGDELEYLKVEIDSIAKTVYKLFPGVDQRYALVVYRDEGDVYVTRTFDFTSSLAEFRETLSEQSANGGGDYPEAVHLALESAGQLDWRDRDTARVLFLVGDAPPHDAFAQRTLDAVEVLRDRGVRVFPVAASGAAMKAEFILRASGFLTLGQYLFLTDHSGVGNPHAPPHVPEYQVERLDRLMIRMIASELAGRRLAAEEVIAIEQGDGTPPRPEQGPIPHQQQRDVSRPASSRSVSLSGLPRWAVLLAAVLGLCVIDSLVTRERR